MKREVTLSVMALACAGAAHAQLGRSQDWNTFGGDMGRTGFERSDPLINKESVAKEFALLYKTKLEENAQGAALGDAPDDHLHADLLSRLQGTGVHGGSNNNVVSSTPISGRCSGRSR